MNEVYTNSQGDVIGIEVDPVGDDWITCFNGRIGIASEFYHMDTSQSEGVSVVYDQQGGYVDPATASDYDIVKIHGVEMTVGETLKYGLMVDGNA